MKINVIEEKVDFEEKEIEINFPFYYQMDFSNDKYYRMLYAKVTEEGKIIKIFENCFHDDSESFVSEINYVDLEELTEEDELNFIFQNKEDFEITEEEYNETENNFLEFVNEHFKHELFTVSTN